MYVDPKAHTMATLYGDDAAVHAAAMALPGERKAPAYPSGAVLALVTWTQRDDPHWFGARIPDAPQSVEFVQAAAAIAGQSLREESPTAGAAELRVSLALSLRPARIPQ